MNMYVRRQQKLFFMYLMMNYNEILVYTVNCKYAAASLTHVNVENASMIYRNVFTSPSNRFYFSLSILHTSSNVLRYSKLCLCLKLQLRKIMPLFMMMTTQ